MDLLYIILIVIFLLISFFFSASETGLTALSRAKIHKLKMDGNKRAIMVSQIRHDKEKFIGALLIGNNVVNIGASALITSISIKYLGEEGVIYATGVASVLVIIFAEIIPKTYAFANSEKVALTVAPFVRVIVKILSPLTGIIQKFVNVVFKSFGVRISRGRESKSAAIDLIRGTIDLHHHEGAVVKHDRDMLGSILDLAETEVSEVMIHRKKMVTVNADLKMEKIISQVLNNIFTRIPVWKNNPDNIIGILNTKDLLRELYSVKGNAGTINLQSILTEPWFIPSTTTLKDQLFAFRERRSHSALVIDEYGTLLGLITLEDILEEIVGSIHDEHDNVFIGIMKESDGYIIDGTVTVRDLNRQLDWNLPDDRAATIAGLLIEEVKAIPDPGEIYEFFGIKFEVLRKNKNQLLYLRLKKIY